MLKQIEGSLGVAEAVALCRPEIICAYPISPQTHIVENLGAMVKKGVRFCTACGKPMAQTAMPESATTTVTESETISRVCPNCGTKVEADVTFCTECGTKL